MTTQQPEALRLAAELDETPDFAVDPNMVDDLAAELRRQQARITDLEAQLEAIGAGGVSGPLIGQPQAMPDLSQLTERGAKAWAGVDAQGLREGFTAADMATVSAQGVAYAALPDGVATLCEYGGDVFTAAQMRDFADATHTLRASHGQAPVGAARADSVQEDAARLDFLIEQRAYVVSDPDACPGYWLHWARPDGSTWVQVDEHPTPRAAIDAGRKQGARWQSAGRALTLHI